MAHEYIYLTPALESVKITVKEFFESNPTTEKRVIGKQETLINV